MAEFEFLVVNLLSNLEKSYAHESKTCFFLFSWNVCCIDLIEFNWF